MTRSAVDLLNERIVPLWLPAEEITGDPNKDAREVVRRRYRKADGTSVTQFNTGGLLIREDSIVAWTGCRPQRLGPSLDLRPTTESRKHLIAEVRRSGPPLLTVLFRKGDPNPGAWVCCSPDEVVLNGMAGPEEQALMEDVALLRSLPGRLGDWRTMARRYAATTDDLSQADAFFGEVGRFASKVGLDEETILQQLHHLRGVDRLTFDLAALETGVS